MTLRKSVAGIRRNSSRFHLERVNREFAETVPAGALVLDAAAGDQPYRHLFAHAHYEAADFEQVDKPYARSTYVCDLTAIPVEDGRFDYVLFNQGLEHMPDPLRVLRELNRVLKPGGQMLCTAPLFYQEHEQPYDYFRYTQFAYREMMPKAGFEIDRLDWLEGYVGTVAYQLEGAARNLPPGIGWLPFRGLFALLSLVFHRLDIRKPYKGGGYPKNYVVVATKKESSGALAPAAEQH
jgi:SAM-dependent methyltransferase